MGLNSSDVEIAYPFKMKFKLKLSRAEIFIINFNTALLKWSIVFILTDILGSNPLIKWRTTDIWVFKKIFWNWWESVNNAQTSSIFYNLKI